MLTSEFEERKNMIHNYFHNEYKWKFKSCENNDVDGEYQYYKGYKKNLDELNFICKIIFPYMVFDTANLIKNNDGEIIGAYIVGTETINPNFNGVYQGTHDYEVHMTFCLCQYGFWIHQSTSHKELQRYLEEL